MSQHWSYLEKPLITQMLANARATRRCHSQARDLLRSRFGVAEIERESVDVHDGLDAASAERVGYLASRKHRKKRGVIFV